MFVIATPIVNINHELLFCTCLQAKNQFSAFSTTFGVGGSKMNFRFLFIALTPSNAFKPQFVTEDFFDRLFSMPWQLAMAHAIQLLTESE